MLIMIIKTKSKLKTTRHIVLFSNLIVIVVLKNGSKSSKSWLITTNLVKKLHYTLPSKFLNFKVENIETS
jgi:hypothetical protein